MKYAKYPKTPHLPWSESVSDDDIILNSDDILKNYEIVVSEKIDGECTSMYNDKIHARSIDSKDHDSRHFVKSLWSTIKNDIPENMRIVGENMYAKHSIYYDKLPSVFLVFAIFENNKCLSWDDLVKWCDLFSLVHVPVLYRGMYNNDDIVKCYTKKSVFGDIQEGYVIRNSSEFDISEFQLNVAKFVRKNHVQTSQHWLKERITPNKVIGV